MFFAIDAAFCSAERVTIVGSVMPAFTRSVTSPVSTFRPSPGRRADLLHDDRPSRPAFVASWRSGSSSDDDDLRTRALVALGSPSTLSDRVAAFSSALHHPARRPLQRSTAACSASSTRCLVSFISVSVAAPTYDGDTAGQLREALLGFSRSESGRCSRSRT